MNKKANKTEIRYIVDIQESEGIKVPTFATVLVPLYGVRRYPNTVFKLINLTRNEVLLLEYLAETMDRENYVTNNHLKRLEFLKYIHDNCGKKLSDEMVKKGFKKLKQEGFLISYDHRGYYQVNPRHYYRGLEKDRKILMRDTFSKVATTFKDKNDIDKVMGFTSVIKDKIKKAQIAKKRIAHKAEIVRLKAEIAEELGYDED